MKTDDHSDTLGTTLRRALLGGITAVALGGFSHAAVAADELNALVWCDHTDPALIAPFEEKFGVKVPSGDVDPDAAKRILASVDSLTDHVLASRAS